MWSAAGWLGVGAAYGPALVALVLSAGGAAMARRWPGLATAVCAGAAAAGWAVLLGGGWRMVLWPRGVAEHVLTPALVLVGAGIVARWVRTRWLAVGVAVFAAWWMAGSGVARPEFWRVLFGGMAAAWVLTRAGVGEPRQGVAAALTVWGGLVVGGAPVVPVGVAMVLTGAVAGVAVAGREGVVPPALVMVGVLAADLAAGRLVRGGVGMVDLACLGAVGAPWLVPAMERGLGRRLRGAAGFVAPIAVAAGVVFVAWVGFRVLRSY